MTIVSADDVVRHAAEDDLPWVHATGGIWLKVLRVDSANGIWVVRNRFEPGARLQTHRHTGPVDGFTISGRWHYLEYDFFNTSGSYIREPAGSVHTLDVPEDNEEITDVLFVMEGVNLNLAADFGICLIWGALVGIVIERRIPTRGINLGDAVTPILYVFPEGGNVRGIRQNGSRPYNGDSSV